MDKQVPRARDLVILGKEIADLMHRSGKENFARGVEIVIREIFKELQKRDSDFQSRDLIQASHAITNCIIEEMRAEHKKADEEDLKRVEDELNNKGGSDRR